MNIQVKTHDECPEWWDSTIMRHNGLFTSSSLWANFQKNFYSGKSTYIEIVLDEKRVMLFLLIDVPIGSFLLPSSIAKIVGMSNTFRTLTFHIQPVIVDDKVSGNTVLSQKLLKKVLHDVFDKAKKKNMSILPATCITTFSLDENRKFVRSLGENASLIGTTRINLHNDEETMYKTMNESVKSGIRKCEKLQITTKIAENSDVTEFYTGLKSGWGVHKLAVNPKRFYTILAEKYPENIKYFLAYDKNVLVAGSGVMLFGKTMLEFSMFVTPYARENKIPGGDLLKWDIIRYGLQHKMSFFDLNMIAVEGNNQLEEKIKQINFYKLKWGGDILYGTTITKLSPPLALLKKLKHKTLGH